MRRLRPLALVAAVCLLLLTTGCAAAPAGSHGGPVRDHVSLVDALRGRGITVGIGGRATDPLLRPEVTRLRLAGKALAAPVVVESFNYDLTDMGQQASKLAEADAARVVLSGPTRPAHVFRRDRVVLLYRGADRTVVAVLTDLLGAEVARRP